METGPVCIFPDWDSLGLLTSSEVELMETIFVVCTVVPESPLLTSSEVELMETFSGLLPLLGLHIF